MLELFKILIVPLLIGLFSWIARGIYSRHLEIIPKINIRFKQGNVGTRMEKDSFVIDWYFNMEFVNSSKYDAYNLFFYMPTLKSFTNGYFIKTKFQKFTHLKSFDTIGIDNLHVTSKVEQSKVSNRHDMSIKFLPEQIKHISFLLEYENEKGKKFYTEFKDNQNIFHRRFKKNLKHYKVII